MEDSVNYTLSIKTRMKFEYWVIGKTKKKHFISAEEEFLKRINHYTKLTYRVFPDVKGVGNDAALVKVKEAEVILGQFGPGDHMILLDEKGPQFTSVAFSEKIRKYQMSSSKRVIFVTGGAFGFHQSVYDKCAEKLSLSKMTFSHQMVRTFFLEQLYRGFTILRGEKYHNG